MPIPVVNLVYTDEYDAGVHTFTSPALEDRVKSTVEVMKVMMSQPKRVSKIATSSITDTPSMTQYDIELNLSK